MQDYEKTNKEIYDFIVGDMYYYKNTTYTEAEIEHAKETFLIHEILLILSLLTVSIFGMIILKRYKVRVLNESLFSVLVGLAGGYVIQCFGNPKYINSITEGYLKVFIVILLPPIIFESAYNIKKKEFYKNLGTILLYAVLGTLISIIFTGYFLWQLGLMNFFKGFNLQQSLAYGALISATDPVCIISAFKEYTTDPNFYLLVFGESILNDAVAMVFYDSIAEYEGGGSTFQTFMIPILHFLLIIVGSSLVGMIIGFLASLIMKKISESQKFISRIEIGILLTLPWFSYLLAHILGLSAIVVIFFIGVSFSIYVKPFISKHSEEVVIHVYEEVAAVAETVVFIFIGISFLADHPYEDLTFALPFSLILLCLIGRFINVAFCSYLANSCRDETSRIEPKKQFFLWFAGVRGAMAFALALKSKFDFPGVGAMFLLLTLITTAFTLLYSSFLLQDTLHKCGVIIENQNSDDSTNQNVVPNAFQGIKEKMYSLHAQYLLPLMQKRKEENVLKQRILEDFCRNDD